MSKVNHYIPPLKRQHYCQKGECHSQQPLNIVCLDVLCRQSPIGCSVCFSQIHKYHKIVSLDQFINDYQCSRTKTSKSVKSKVQKQYEELKQKVRQFDLLIKQKLYNFSSELQEYFCFINNQSQIRKELSDQLQINLEPETISQSSLYDLQKSVKFIISNSLFKQNRIVNVSSILKQNQNKTLALLDKISNQTNKCHRQIQNCFRGLEFAKQTLNKQHSKFRQMVSQFNNKNQMSLIQDSKNFACKQIFNETLNFSPQKNIDRQQLNSRLHKNCFSIFEKTKHSSQIRQIYPSLNFGIYKHENLNYDGKTHSLKSNITALNPQFALLTPTLNIQPQKQQNWSIKIKSCRNFASNNTLSLGLCSLSNLKQANFEKPQSDQNMLLVTSQGYIIKDGRCEKSKFVFGEGDTVHLKYDPFYNILIVSKDNGRKITLKTKACSGLYGCVRMTYASDEVQIV